MKKCKIVELQQRFFDLQKDGSVTYNVSPDKAKHVAFITEKTFELATQSDCVIYLYKNPKTPDGTWPCYPKASSLFGDEFNDSTSNHYGMLHRGYIIFKD